MSSISRFRNEEGEFSSSAPCAVVKEKNRSTKTGRVVISNRWFIFHFSWWAVIHLRRPIFVSPTVKRLRIVHIYTLGIIASIGCMHKLLEHEATRAEPYLQATFDSCGDLLSEAVDISEEALEERPNLVEAIHLLVTMKEAIYPTADFEEHVRMPIEEVVEWRDRLKASLENLGLARQLWIADSLGFPAFQEESSH